MNRLELRFDFIKKHSRLFKQYLIIHGYPQGSNLIVKNISELARKEIGYSDKTSSCDIAWTLAGFYKDVIQIIKL
jgi:hypothetical protein